MAGDWIKIEMETPDKPEVVNMSSRLRIDQDAVTGKLVRIWTWADRNSVNGEHMQINDAFINRLTNKTGFADAMRAVGWLSGEDGDLTFSNFSRHNGNTAKKRSETNRRVAEHRNCNAKSVTKSVTEVLQKALPEKRREEKSIEDKKIPPNPQGGNAVDLAITIWEICPKIGRERSSQDQLLAQVRKLPAVVIGDAEGILESLRAWKLSESWTKDNGSFVPGIHRWVKDGKWKSKPDPAKAKHAGATQMEITGKEF